MSDQRIALPVRLSDPTTPSQQASVDSSGRLSVIAIGTKTNNSAAPSTNNLGVLSALANAAAPSWTEGNEVTLSVDLSGNQRVLAIGSKTNNNAAPGATNVGALTALANAANPSWTEGNEVLLSVDLVGYLRARGGKTNNNAAPTGDNLGVLPAVANAAAQSWTEGDQVLLSTDLSGNLRVTPTETALTSPSTDNETSASLAAGSSVTVSSATIATASFLYGIDIACSVPFKAVVQKVENGGAAVIYSTLFGEAGNSIQWRPPDKGFTKIATHTAGTNNFEVVFTNLDPSQAADVYAEFFYAQS